MTAYYNEHDPGAAEWLRELIREGLIAPGDVDERDLQLVTADDVRGYRQVHLFAGIGGWSLALRLAGWGDDRPVWTGSCPCQPFSSAGRQKGNADARHLWPHMERLVRQCRPGVVFGEQVPGAVGHGWLDGVCTDLEREGYAVGAVVLGSHSVGAPHVRNRLYWVADAGPLPAWADRRPGQADGPGGGVKPAGRRPGQADAQPAGRGSAGDLADAPCRHGGHERCRGRGQGDGREELPTGRLGASGGVAVADDPARERTDGGTVRADDRVDAGRGGDAGGLVDADGRRCEVGPEQHGDAAQDPADGHSRRPHADGHGFDGRSAGVVGYPAGDGRQQGPARPPRPEPDARWPGTPWADARLVACRDGKLRRVPPEPEFFPLAHGLPGRVGLLRGYGNAINPYTAEAFVRAAEESGAGRCGRS